VKEQNIMIYKYNTEHIKDTVYTEIQTL